MAMDIESRLPPGFRFHPTEEELVGYYLARKVACQEIDLQVIREVDLYRIEPWDLQGRHKYGEEEQTQWYFFSFKDRKYPSGTRTNRATAAGFWKATGRDKPVLSNSRVIGMRKTLVFYKGRAPNGRRTNWIMHEYRLQTSHRGPTQEEGWVVCRAFQKPTPSQRPCYEYSSCPTSYSNLDAQYGHEFFVDMSRITNSMNYSKDPGIDGVCERSAMFLEDIESKDDLLNQVLDIPKLKSPSLSAGLSTRECLQPNAAPNDEHSARGSDLHDGQFIDWKALDSLLYLQNETTSSNPPMAAGNYEAGAQSQADQFLSFHGSYC